MNKLIVNFLSASRLFFGLSFLYVVLFEFNIISLIIIFGLTVLSDILDGFWARKHDLASPNGARIDVIFDFLFIFFSTLSLVLIDLVPFWFLFIIILKILEFFITSGRDGLKYEKFGTFVALMFYTLPIVVILINSKNITLILSLIITICAVASSVLRIKNMSDL
ncbi:MULTISPECIES: CDP-alcohol phosphatidyltransferase family protein [unclassified Methanobrevibacter]|uniref:CDP-alcohol phosphatidyltransferase family protein n=1 Tax=unclassified Methanobrevibacter TaxID=2638681 RepID=UPI002736C405|nr:MULTISPECIES: CDP-alcohol phosphatidyltransferase family protein [unclassified Methanobrevibacter]